MLQKAQPTLEEVEKQFKNWRRRRKNRRAEIPLTLWEAAASLSGQYSVHEISKSLHLNHTALRKQSKRQQGSGLHIAHDGTNRTAGSESV